MAIEVFRRIEQKYIVSKEEYETIIKLACDRLRKDPYFESVNASIYFDTQNSDLIISSLDKPIYKEKVRVRSYGVSSLEDKVFLEIKRKYNGIVNKRRIIIKLKDFYNYLDGKQGLIGNKQIVKEIDYYFKYYNLIPNIYLAYDRKSYIGAEDNHFRVTFDTNVRSRTYDLNLEKGDYGDIHLNNKYIMEVKSIKSMPLWFSSILSELKIYPSSYSKYGEIYKKRKEEINNV